MKSYLKSSDSFNIKEQSVHNYIFDSNARLAEQNSERPLKSIFSKEEISAGVQRCKKGEGAEFIIEMMNDPSVVQRFEDNA